MIMRRSKYAETVVNTMTRDDDQTPSGRGDSDYYLKMPHEFPSQNTNMEHQQSAGIREIRQAASTLQNLLPKSSSPSISNGYPRERIVTIKNLPATRSTPDTVDRANNKQVNFNYHEHEKEVEVPLEQQPYRTTPLLLPHAKTIHHVGELGNKFLEPSKDNTKVPYRTASLVMPEPRTIHEVGPGGPVYQQFRGPQYWAERGYTPIKLDSHSTLATNKTPGISNSYNSPLGLYSQDTLDSIMQENNNNNNNNSSNNTQYKPMAVTPDPVMPPTRQARRRLTQPNINQSNSFKKVMYSVMRDSEF